MSENRRIARAAGVVGGLTLASRISGLLRDVVTGYFFGAGPVADAFFVAFRLPNLMRRFVGEGAMSVAFIPVFGEYLTRRSPAEAERAFRAVATGFAVVLAGVTALAALLAPYWLELLAPGFSARPETMALTVSLTRWLVPYLFLVSMVALLGGFLNALRHFVAPAVSPVLLNLAMIGAALALAPVLSMPIYALVIGVLLGGLLQVGIQVAVLARRGVRLAPLWEPRHPAVARVLRLLAPSTVGAAMYQINVVLSTSLASLLAPGSVSCLWYAGRVFEFPIGLVAVAIGTAALPSFAAQAARGARDEMRHSLAFAAGLTNLLAVPASVALVLLARPITAVLFQHGAFEAAEVERTASALQAYALGLWALSLVRIMAPAFYALGDVRTPVLAAAAAFLVNAAASLALVGRLPNADGSALAAAIGRAADTIAVADLGPTGLALAASLAVTVNLACLVAPLARRLGGLELAAIGVSLWRSLLASMPMGVLVYAAAQRVDWTAAGGTGVKIAWLAAIVAAGLAAFAGTAIAVGAPEVERLRRALRERNVAT